MGAFNLGAGKESEVVLGLATLRKLETDDVAGARKLIRTIVADDYLDQIEKTEPWWFQAASHHSRIVERVGIAAKELPSLAAAVEQRKEKRATDKQGRL